MGGVYKLGAIRSDNNEWQYRIKLSNDLIKASNPGILQIASDGKNRTLINEAETPLPAGTKPLLVPIVRNGKRTLPHETLTDIHKRALTNWKELKEAPPFTQLHPELDKTKRQLLADNGFKI